MDLKEVDKIFFKARDMKVGKTYSIDENQAEIIKSWWKELHIYLDGYELTFSQDFKRITKT
jgi:hypothetical protein